MLISISKFFMFLFIIIFIVGLMVIEAFNTPIIVDNANQSTHHLEDVCACFDGLSSLLEAVGDFSCSV